MNEIMTILQSVGRSRDERHVTEESTCETDDGYVAKVLALITNERWSETVQPTMADQGQSRRAPIALQLIGKTLDDLEVNDEQ
jgi:hypothetical protein